MGEAVGLAGRPVAVDFDGVLAEMMKHALVADEAGEAADHALAPANLNRLGAAVHDREPAILGVEIGDRIRLAIVAVTGVLGDEVGERETIFEHHAHRRYSPAAARFRRTVATGCGNGRGGAAMTTSEITTFAIDGFDGSLMHPFDPGYDEARRVFNGMIDRYPAVIARCTSADDVAAVVRMAQRERLELTVRAGGHGVSGSAVADDAVCCDLRGMKGITIDPMARTARVEAGVLWGELDAATQEHGLAVTGGRVSSTGVAGLVLGSGSGWIERSFGFTCDNLISAEVVTADGRQVVASERENPGLFWGLRGGGGNFGIVTAFHFNLAPLGPIVLGGMLVYPASIAGDVVRFYRDFMATAPDALGTGLTFFTAPPADYVPVPVRGHPVVGIICCYTGSPADGEEAVRPLREFGPPPAIDMIQPMPYVAVQQLLDAGNPSGLQNYWSADFLAELPDEAVDTLVALATKPVSALSQIVLVAGGGAVARVPSSATALGERTAPWNIRYLSLWADLAATERNIAYTKSISASMKPWTTGRVYLNYIGDEGHGRVAAAFGPEKYARLAALKKVWDPTNVFRHNQNIPPAE